MQSNDDYEDYASGDAGYGQQSGGYGGYSRQEPGHGSDAQYSQRDPYGPQAPYGGQGGYDEPVGYDDAGRADYGYQQPSGSVAGSGYGPQDYGQPPEPGYGTTASGPQRYDGPGPQDGYPPRHGGGTGAYPGQDAGNDWYGGQPAAASGASFADTGTYALNGRVIDEYGTGPREVLRNPARGYPPAPGQPQGRAQLPAPARPIVSGPQAVPRTGAHERYDEYDSRPGYGGEPPADRGTRGPGGDYPTTFRGTTGEYPAAVRNPSGSYPATTRNPSGSYPATTRNPSGEYPTTISNPSGSYPAAGRNPSGSYPATARNPSGSYPATARNPSGSYPVTARNPSGEYPTTVSNPSGSYPAAGTGGYDAYADGYGQDGSRRETGGRSYAEYDDPAVGYEDYAAASDPYQDRYGEGAGQGGTGKNGKSGRAKAKPKKGAAGQGRRGGKRSVVLAAITVGAVVIAGAAAYVFLISPNSHPKNPDAVSPLPSVRAQSSAQACEQKLGTYCHIETRVDDPTPLTIAEVFPPVVNNETNGHVTSSFTLAAYKADTKCSAAVIGSSLITELKDGYCTQVLRASYVSGDSKIIGTIGVINLATTTGAHYAGKVVDADDFIAPLAATKGVAKNLGQGTGVVESHFKGHYLILTWAEFANGSTPSTTAEDKELEQFSSDLVAGTVNDSLSQRMVTGVAPTPGATA